MSAKHILIRWSARIVCYLSLLFSSLSAAVEVTNASIFGQFEAGGGAAAWSPDGTKVMIAERNLADSSMDLCVYALKTRKKQECFYLMKLEPDIGVWSIDWTDQYIHAEIGFDDGTVIVRLPGIIGTKTLRRRNEKVKVLPSAHSEPAFDRWTGLLFFDGEDGRDEILAMGANDDQPRKYVSGLSPSVTRRYLWYSYVSEESGEIIGIARLDKSSNVKELLTSEHVDVSVSPRQDEAGAIFIRSRPDSSDSELFAYIMGRGVVGPLSIGPLTKGEFLHKVRISPSGDSALVTSSLVNEYHHKIQLVRVVKLQWGL